VKQKGREPAAPAPKHAGGPRRAAGNIDYLQDFPPFGPLHLLEQHWELDVHAAPAALHVWLHEGDAEQFGSAQSVRPSQSLSTESLQISVTGVQVPGSRKGFTDAK
jgi:hypothetical protein